MAEQAPQPDPRSFEEVMAEKADVVIETDLPASALPMAGVLAAKGWFEARQKKLAEQVEEE